MGLDFDVIEFCKKLKNSKQPPYQCPVVECGKIYKSMCGLQYHLHNFDHTAPPPLTPHPTPGRKKGRGSHHSRQPSKTSDLLTSPTREGLTYAEAQKMVEFEFNNRAERVCISEFLPVMSLEDFQAKYKNCVSQVAGQGAIESRPVVSEEKVRLPEPTFTILEPYNIADAPPRPNAYIRFIERSVEELDVEVEYDMDEEDAAWLSLINQRRSTSGVTDVPVDTFELLMDRLEKESYFQMQTYGQSGEAPAVIDDDAVCCICMDGECQNSNVILFCDMCNLAVHQDCYGVPYIPEGQWLCRRCLQSPSRAVDCVLCPNNGGAFKQTDRGHWAHVVCALWIPEVRFANTVFLEPIDSIETIPPARWKLTCYICKQRGVGACIQCHKTNCYSAFHVTCAQHAGLFMKMDTVRDSHSGDAGPVMVQKTAFCDTHTPPDASPRPLPASKKEKVESEDSRQKMKKARRILAKKRSTVPVISIPTIPPDRIQEIASLVTIPKKSQLIQRLIAYWTLKRQYRNGVPLLRRLQSSHLSRRDEARTGNEVGPSIDELYRQLKYWQQLRQDLEKARLLCELVRKRERHKNELTKVSELVLMGSLQPLACSLRRLLELIQLRDAGEIFSDPVDQTEVLDYSDVVKEPMDLSTMRTKIENCQYSSLAAFEADFNLMIRNCMAYNSKDTIFYRAAIRMRDQGGALIRQARRDLDSSIDPATGMLYADGGAAERAQPALNKQALTEEALVADIDRQFAAVIDREAATTSTDCERLCKLLELLDRSQEIKPVHTRLKRNRLIKGEITKLRRRISQAAATANSESDSEREDSSDEEKEASRPTRQTKQHDRPSSVGIKRPRKKRLSETPSSPPPARPPLESQSPDVEASPVPTTPAKLIATDAQTPLTVSPSGVNRRTAVLFTRKAQAAFRKSDPPPSPTPATDTSAVSSSSRRRVGRPRKNLDSSISQSSEPAVPSANPLLTASGAEDEASAELPDPVVPCTESFRVYRSGGADIPAETDEDTQSESSCSGCSTTDGSSGSSDGSSSLDLQHPATSAPDSSTEEDATASGMTSQMSPEPLDLVWAKCRGYPWYPALIINPKMPRGFLHNGVPIPSPPADVLALAANYTETVYLVLFFDTKRTWQWLPRTKLEPLGNVDVDQSKLTESRKPTDRKAVRKAFQEAQQHQTQVLVGNKRGRSSSVAAEATPAEEN